jgi:hypothetical protein
MDSPTGIVSGWAHMFHPTAGMTSSLLRATMNGEPQYTPCIAVPVLLSTITEPGIDDPAGIVVFGSSIRADMRA